MCSCDPPVRFLAQKIQANFHYCYVRRRAQRTSLGPGLEHPSLRSDFSLAAKRRAEALHVVFFSTKHPNPARKLLLCVATKDARWVPCYSCSLDPSSRRPTASCSLAAVRRGDCVRASWLYSFIVQRIDRYSYSCFCVCLVLLLYHAGSAPLDFIFGLVARARKTGNSLLLLLLCCSSLYRYY